MVRKRKPIKPQRWISSFGGGSERHVPRKTIHARVWEISSVEWVWELFLDEFEIELHSRGTSATERGAKIAATKALKKILEGG